MRILKGQMENLRPVSGLISVKLSAHNCILVRRSMSKKFCTSVIFHPCYINEHTFDRWRRNQTSQSWEDDKRDEGSGKKLIFPLLLGFRCLLEMKHWIQRRGRDGDRVSWADQSPFTPREDQMKNEKQTLETVTKEDSRVIERQGKRHPYAPECVWVCMAD